MNTRKILLVGLLLLSTGSGYAMRSSVTINFDRYPTPAPVVPYYPVTYVPTYYAPTYVWPTWGYYDDYYWWNDYNENSAKAFVKTCAVMGVLAVAFAIIGAITSR